MPKLVEFIYSIQIEDLGYDETVEKALDELTDHVIGGNSSGKLVTRVTEQTDSFPTIRK